VSDLLWAIPLLPLAGFLLNGLAGRRLGQAGSAAVGCIAAFLSFAVASILVWQVAAAAPLQSKAYTWFSVGEFQVAAGLRLDNLASVMVLVVTGIGFLIHVYSIGYMKGDDGFSRYFAYLNLFLFAMTLLVLADNLLLMFVGWEGVGLCSYLLIGFWFKEGERADAGKKAFIVNRIGDFGFLLGMFLLFTLYGSLGFEEMKGRTLAAEATTVACLLLLLGACGKSAQVPLYVWLPDAMAGPTPVSALIHAATMVTAGVYMIARLDFVYALSPVAQGVVALIGGVTALLAGLLALTENNIKKVLAYSTISQLGFMFCGVAAGGAFVGIFHVTTHAFFKALLFLGAGAVIHALHNEEDMRRMGGLRKRLRIPFWCFIVGTWAIAGIAPFAGFWSKEAILGSVYERGGPWLALWALLTVAAGITAYYMTRLVILTFFGESRANPKDLEHAHEPPPSMQVALWTLMALSVAGGTLILFLPSWLAAPPHHTHLAVLASSQLASILGIGAAIVLQGPLRKGLAAWLVESEIARALERALANKLYVDQAYEFLFVLPMKLTAFLLWLVVDRWIVDGLLVHGWAALAGGGARHGRQMQAGVVNASLAVFALGSLVVLALLVLKT
jgi:NADH-quinone oxidoreductase subunit L